MERIIVIRYAEIYLKGKNQKIFLKSLLENIKHLLKPYNVKVFELHSRFVVKNINDENLDDIINILALTAGISSISIASQLETSEREITNFVSKIKVAGTFKIDCNRADKKFPIKSADFEKILGELVLKNNKNAKVKLNNPEKTIYIDIRENGITFIYDEITEGIGGLPIEGKANGLLLLSGGIDSPVAGFYMGKRGLRQDFLHFNSYPYTSPLAKEKVITLAKKIAPFTGAKKLYIISMTKLQEAFHNFCREDYAVTLLRRSMYQIAQMICLKFGYKCIVTGENLGQVASQTLEGLTVSDSALNEIIAFRPLIGLNKNEIIKVANKIGSYEISILPYEDCCTVFLPKNPVIKPKIDVAEKEEEKIDLINLQNAAISAIEIIDL